MLVLKTRWRMSVSFEGKTIHSLETDNKEFLSVALATLGEILQTDDVNLPRRKYIIIVEALDVPTRSD